MPFPDGRRFAFSILDDTDDSTLENVRPVYELLDELGFRTTKTVWPMSCPEGSRLYYAADTLQREEYLAFVKNLVSRGFELAFHGATMESSHRARTQEALAFLLEHFGGPGRIHANHGQNRENLYWGPRRFQLAPLRWLVARLRPEADFSGENVDSPYFWGDLCRQHFDYVRNFTFTDLDMRRCNPQMPYQLSGTPYVRHWFSTTDAPDVQTFKQRLHAAALDELEARGGVCIVSTHLGKGFACEGRVEPGFEALLRNLAERPGWFVPTSRILDYLRAEGAGGRLGALAQLRLELRYVLDQLRIHLRKR